MKPRRHSGWRDLIFLLLLALPPALLTGWLHPRRPEWARERPAIARVTVDTARQWGATALWVDAREARGRREGQVPEAVALNETDWETLLPDFMAAWSPEKRVVVYCDTTKCNASEEVARRLQRELGVTNVFVLEGGWAAWKEAQP